MLRAAPRLLRTFCTSSAVSGALNVDGRGRAEPSRGRRAGVGGDCKAGTGAGRARGFLRHRRSILPGPRSSNGRRGDAAGRSRSAPGPAWWGPVDAVSPRVWSCSRARLVLPHSLSASAAPASDFWFRVLVPSCSLFPPPYIRPYKCLGVPCPIRIVQMLESGKLRLGECFCFPKEHCVMLAQFSARD